MTVMCEKGEMKVMAEYLSPGVYVEEFDSGSKPMEGVGTSTAGFIGLAERGPVEGLPQLVTIWRISFPCVRSRTFLYQWRRKMLYRPCSAGRREMCGSSCSVRG